MTPSTCSSCRHWTERVKTPLGRCSAIVDECYPTSVADVESPAAVIAVIEGNDCDCACGHLLTVADFGCIKHSPKEPTIKFETVEMPQHIQQQISNGLKLGPEAIRHSPKEADGKGG